MSVAFRSTLRHEIKPENWIPIKIKRTLDPIGGSVDAEEAGEVVDGHIVDISTNGIKIRSAYSFSFHESIVLDVPRLEGGKSIDVAAEVRWTQPDRNKEETWSTGCIIAEEFPQDYINEMAKSGFLERRESIREKIREKANSKWESAPNDIPVVISDVSATGFGILSPEEIELGRRIQIDFKPVNGSRKESFTARAVRQEKVDGGYFIGCKVLRGSTYQLLGQAVSANVRKRSFSQRMLKACNFLGLSMFIALVVWQIVQSI